MIQTQFFPGEFCDVDWSPADDTFVFARIEQPGRVVVEWRRFGEVGASSSDDYALGRWALYLRCAADGAGNVLCVAQDGRDPPIHPAIVVLFPTDGPPREIACPAGPAYGQNAVEVVGNRPGGGFLVHVVQSPTSYWSNFLSRDGVWSSIEIRAGMPQTSQGFADGTDRMDDVRASVPGMVCPSTADGLSVGQAGPPDRLRGLHNGVYFTALQGVAFEPHVVSDGAGRWMACARTPQGAALLSLAPPFVAEDAIPGPQEPPAPPIPNPPPPQEPTPMQMPDPVFDTIIDFYTRFGLPEGESAQRELQGRLCQTVRARHGGQWGWKRSAGPESADAVAFRAQPGDAAFFVWDCVRDAGGPDRAVTLSRGAEGELVRQTFIAVEPKDWLAGSEPGPTDPPPVEPPPPTGTDLSAVHAKLDAILARLNQPFKLEARL